jgi:hypothetical protein
MVGRSGAACLHTNTTDNLSPQQYACVCMCRYIVRQVQLGLKSPQNAVAIAQGGLDYWCVLRFAFCVLRGASTCLDVAEIFASVARSLDSRCFLPSVQAACLPGWCMRNRRSSARSNPRPTKD